MISIVCPTMKKMTTTTTIPIFVNNNNNGSDVNNSNNDDSYGSQTRSLEVNFLWVRGQRDGSSSSMFNIQG